MPVPNYSLLKGHPTSRQVQGPHGRPPHLHVRLVAGGTAFDIAVNILSADGSEILYHVNHAFTPPQPDALLALPVGPQALPAGHPLALDFVRQNIVRQEDMGVLSASDAEDLTASDLHNELDDLVARAIQDPQVAFFAFGSSFQGGIHDIHFNQGNPPGRVHGQDFSLDNGVFQDGALMAYFPTQQRWVGAFIAFQSQSWATDDGGNPV